mmetsp:Transcript_139121/g.346778  ORF Transcript_139121/g.346778 Transcript_139121/m.346778 type:complete len:205 (+) Transcript_139121:65-679(+)
MVDPVAEVATLADEQQALALEGGAEENLVQQPRLAGRRRFAATAAAALAMAALGLIAYVATSARSASPGALAPAAVEAPAATEDAVQLFGDDAVCGQCQCNCAWVHSPNACIPQANDGGCCWSCCCNSFGGDRVYNTDSYHYRSYGEQTIVVHHHHYGGYHYHDGYYPAHSSGSGSAMIWWIILFVILLVLGFLALYYYLCKKP